jgi:hypothetical protein
MDREGWKIVLLEMIPSWFFESLPLLVWRWTSVIKRLFVK